MAQLPWLPATKTPDTGVLPHRTLSLEWTKGLRVPSYHPGVLQFVNSANHRVSLRGLWPVFIIAPTNSVSPGYLSQFFHTDCMHPFSSSVSSFFIISSNCPETMAINRNGKLEGQLQLQSNRVQTTIPFSHQEHGNHQDHHLVLYHTTPC